MIGFGRAPFSFCGFWVSRIFCSGPAGRKAQVSPKARENQRVYVLQQVGRNPFGGEMNAPRFRR